MLGKIKPCAGCTIRRPSDRDFGHGQRYSTAVHQAVRCSCGSVAPSRALQLCTHGPGSRTGALAIAMVSYQTLWFTLATPVHVNAHVDVDLDTPRAGQHQLGRPSPWQAFYDSSKHTMLQMHNVSASPGILSMQQLVFEP